MPTCAICNVEKLPGKQTTFFHACDDHSHYRLFICDDCFKKTPMQRTLHEVCYECRKHLSLEEECERDPQTRLDVLDRAIEDFENSHAALFKTVPSSDDPDA
ncbi:hypothetical protein ACFLQR_02460 [Verrucomicrobiota bacterium]